MAKIHPDEKWFKRNRIIVTLIAPVFFMISILAVRWDSKPEIVHHAAIERPGYTAAPETYYVEASPRKKWADYWADNWILVVLGFIVCAGGPLFYINWVETNAKEGSWVPIAVAWIIGAVLIFAWYVARHGGMEWHTSLTAAEYERYKNTLDHLFPLKK
jgi:NADH:ubiquinone oxidoreductase subunit 3 (subunit A)